MELGQGVYARGPWTQQPMSSQNICAILMSDEPFPIPSGPSPLQVLFTFIDMPQ